MARARPFFRFLAGLLSAAGLFSLLLMLREGPDEGRIAEHLRPWIGVLMFSLTAAMSYVAATGRWPWRLPDDTHK
jgi:hypothetical protein